MQTISEYTNEQAIEDGMFFDITTPFMRGVKWVWLCTPNVKLMDLSQAAYAELYNEAIKKMFSKEEINPIVSEMNGHTLWLFLEAPSELGVSIFKIITPEEY